MLLIKSSCSVLKRVNLCRQITDLVKVVICFYSKPENNLLLEKKNPDKLISHKLAQRYTRLKTGQ